MRRQVDPVGHRLEGQHAIAEGWRRELGHEDPERDGSLHRRAAHRARNVDQRHELAQVHVLGQSPLERRKRAEASRRRRRRLEHLEIALLNGRAHRLERTRTKRGPLRVHQVRLERRERATLAPEAKLHDLVRHQRLALHALLAHDGLAQVQAGGDAGGVVRVPIARGILRRREHTVERLIEERLAVALQAQRSNSRETNLLPPARSHQHLSRAELAVQGRAQLAVLARRGRRVGGAEEPLREALGQAQRTLVKFHALAGCVLRHQREARRSLLCRGSRELRLVCQELLTEELLALVG